MNPNRRTCFAAMLVLAAVAVVGGFAPAIAHGSEGYDRVIARRSALLSGATLEIGRPSAGGVSDETPAVPASNPDDVNWGLSFGQGTNGTVYAIVEYQGDVIVGGDFTKAGNIDVNHIARWDGFAWHPLGAGVNNTVTELVIHEGRLVAGGLFTTAGGTQANRVAAWDGVAWSTFGGGLNSGVYALESFQGRLYAGGPFMQAGGVPARHLASWNGTAWSEVGGGIDDRVLDLAVYGSHLIVGGYFSAAGALTTHSLVRWDGSNWSNFPAPPSAGTVWIMGMASDGPDLIVAGYIPSIGGVARWNGTSWSALGSGVNADVFAVTVFNGRVIVGGSFTLAGGAVATGVAQWDGTAWSSLAGGTNLGVQALALHHDALVAGGYFTHCDNYQVTSHLAQWDGSAWAPVGGGLNGAAIGLVEYDGDLVVGGAFQRAGDIAANNVARWDGQRWHALGEGVNGVIYSVTTYQGDLIVTGSFTSAGGVPANMIARWDGSAWHPLAAGFTLAGYGYVNVVLEYDGDLIAGGLFSDSGGMTTNCIARWDGNQWNAMGTGMDDQGAVFGLAIEGGDLIACGYFTQAGGVPAHSVARWDGLAWQALGSGAFTDGANAVAVYGGELYIAGAFSEYNGVTCRGVGRKTATGWSEVGGGVSGYSVFGTIPYALSVYDGELVLGGLFEEAGGVPVGNLAAWNGSSWRGLGSGIDSQSGATTSNSMVWGLTHFANSLFIGGDFAWAGERSSRGLAQWGAAATTSVTAPEVGDESGSVSATIGMIGCRPNPFHGETVVSYALAKTSAVKVAIYDALGRHIATLLDGVQSAGVHELRWDGRHHAGTAASPGIYLARVETGAGVSGRKLILTR